ncbi:hypothetical protein ARMSODRAFT_1024161 [Armillaria solidipes]|uniref:Auxin efflux carrier n=1 Tax=Armillaria solidipes TaxID=1076256 RepID=A0A2H3AWP4_9AGAR|nr:hypothetical protein ARMSODRAFT_1024161 [Armillaria solidipes]
MTRLEVVEILGGTSSSSLFRFQVLLSASYMYSQSSSSFPDIEPGSETQHLRKITYILNERSLERVGIPGYGSAPFLKKIRAISWEYIDVRWSLPLDSDIDPQLGVSYISVLILAWNIVMWICGAAKTLAWDYAPGVPQGDAANVRVGWREKPVAAFFPRADDEQALDGKASSERWRPTLPTSTQDCEVIRQFLSLYGSQCSSAYWLDTSGNDRVIPPLKELPDTTVQAFVEVDDGPSYRGPDGNPPLSFIITIAEFVGNMNVPMTLILLGASFARMKIPRPFTKIPLPALFWVSFCKLALLPVIGVLLTPELTHRGVVPKEALVERFVATLLSGSPSAVSQLIVTQVYAKDHDLDTLSGSLVATICLHVHFHCNYNRDSTFTPIDSRGDRAARNASSSPGSFAFPHRFYAPRAQIKPYDRLPVLLIVVKLPS